MKDRLGYSRTQVRIYFEVLSLVSLQKIYIHLPDVDSKYLPSYLAGRLRQKEYKRPEVQDQTTATARMETVNFQQVCPHFWTTESCQSAETE